MIAGPVQVVSMKHHLQQRVLHCQLTSAGGLRLLYVDAKRLMHNPFPPLALPFLLHPSMGLVRILNHEAKRRSGTRPPRPPSRALQVGPVIPECKVFSSTRWNAERRISCPSSGSTALGDSDVLKGASAGAAARLPPQLVFLM